MQIPPTIAGELALTRQNIALSVIKSSADQDRAIANILDQSAQAISQSSRGNNVNISA